jgi:Rap1a immunity proteins
MNIAGASCVVALFLLFLAKPTSAQTLTLETYQHPESMYLAGARDGLIAYDLAVPANERRFCLPPNLAVTTHQADDMMLRWAKRQTSNIDSTPIGLALLRSFEEAYPCSRRPIP